MRLRIEESSSESKLLAIALKLGLQFYQFRKQPLTNMKFKVAPWIYQQRRFFGRDVGLIGAFSRNDTIPVYADNDRYMARFHL